MYNGLVKKVFIASLLFFLLVLKPNFVLAKDASASAVPLQVQYDLPYPGLLPDNPLYYLKAIRDNLLKFFISDPLKKSQFDLLQANKRLGAAEQLLNKGKNDLAITTLSKSGNYFEDAITQVETAKKTGEYTSTFLTELLTAARKHQSEIFKMEKGQKGDTLLNLKFMQERAHDFEERVDIIKS